MENFVFLRVDSLVFGIVFFKILLFFGRICRSSTWSRHISAKKVAVTENARRMKPHCCQAFAALDH